MSQRKRSWLPWVRRREQDADVERELRTHLELEAEEQRERGLPAEEARYAALRVFGNATLVKEAILEMLTWNTVEAIWHDICYSARSLRKNIGFTAVAVLTLALGIGANTAIFSVINAVLLKPLAFKNPDRLVDLRETENAPGNFPLSGLDYLDWQAQNQTLEGTALYKWSESSNLSGGGDPEAVIVRRTEANFFSVLGVQPLLGRTFVQGEDKEGKDHVAILSYGFWQRHFSGNRDVIGKTVDLNAEPYTVIGVMPEQFNFPAGTELWAPCIISAKELGPRGNHGYLAVGRIKSGVSLETARADLLTVSRRVTKQYRGNNDPADAVLIPLKEQIMGSSGQQLIVLLGAVALVLLVACANIANLLLARATGRQREIALRAVLGASRWRIARQLLVESVMLSLAGATLGLLAAWWCVSMAASLKTLPIPRENPLQIDVTVLLFTIAISIVVGLLFGLAPAIQASRTDLVEELKASAQAVSSPRGWQRALRRGLVIGEIAVSLALLVGAGLLLRTFARLRTSDIGIDPHNVLLTRVVLPDTKYTNLAQRREFFDGLLERIQQVPGVQTAAVATEIPLQGGNNGYITVEGDKDPDHAQQLVENNYITPEYFRSLGIPLLQGRVFSKADMDRTEDVNLKIDELFRLHPDTKSVPPDLSLVAVISKSMAHMYWPNQDPIGKTYKSGGGGGITVQVIGVVGDAKQWGLRQRPIPENYFPITLQLDQPGLPGIVVVKTILPPGSLVTPLRGKLRQLDPKLAGFLGMTMDDVISLSMGDTTLYTWLLGGFATLALVLAAVGLYSVLSYLVTQRTREIGIRMALGAQQGDVLRLVVGQGTTLTVIGVAVGVAIALALTRLLKSLLFEVKAGDPSTFVGVVIVLAVVALLACYIPARRAARVNPIEALRHD